MLVNVWFKGILVKAGAEYLRTLARFASLRASNYVACFVC
jgi:hypothetical protein